MPGCPGASCRWVHRVVGAGPWMPRSVPQTPGIRHVEVADPGVTPGARAAKRLHAHRAAGGHRDHRAADRDPASGARRARRAHGPSRACEHEASEITLRCTRGPRWSLHRRRARPRRCGGRLACLAGRSGPDLQGLDAAIAGRSSPAWAILGGNDPGLTPGAPAHRRQPGWPARGVARWTYASAATPPLQAARPIFMRRPALRLDPAHSTPAATVHFVMMIQGRPRPGGTTLGSPGRPHPRRGLAQPSGEAASPASPTARSRPRRGGKRHLRRGRQLRLPRGHASTLRFRQVYRTFPATTSIPTPLVSGGVIRQTTRDAGPHARRRESAMSTIRNIPIHRPRPGGGRRSSVRSSPPRQPARPNTPVTSSSAVRDPSA